MPSSAPASAAGPGRPAAVEEPARSAAGASAAPRHSARSAAAEPLGDSPTSLYSYSGAAATSPQPEDRRAPVAASRSPLAWRSQ